MNKPLAPSDLLLAAPEKKKASPFSRLSKRKKLFLLLAAGVAKAALVFGGFEMLVASHYAVTDNAYVGADVAQVTPRIEGAVASVLASDTQRVGVGQVLVVLDDTDARLRLDQAEAALAQAERRVAGWYANDRGLAAQVAARVADQARAAAQTEGARSDLERARLDFERRRALAASGAVSREELTRATNSFNQAKAALAAAQAGEAQAAAGRAAAVGSLDANQALTAGFTPATNPEVAAARARLAQAREDLARTVIRSPLNGVVVKRQVQVGQRVQPGAQLMTVAPLDRAYVDANFKEGQLARVRPGQPVELVSDLYGEKVKFHGRVEGLSGGTGAAFALIPAQNATGNWIKVVQRVPVRIRLDPEELQAHPLRVGLSMKAKVRLVG
jgi:membrane fusion protein (multidrug efflux system)